MIIDTHVHCFSDKIAQRALSTMKAMSSELSLYTDGTVNGVLESMEKSGVDISVICPVATNTKQNKKVNDFCIDVNNNNKNLISLGALHPKLEDWKDELKRIKDAGLVGIKLHPEYQSFFPDEAHMIEIYEYCNKLDMAIVFHAGVDIGFPDPVHATPDRLKKVCERVDTSRFAFAHMGGWNLWDGVEEYLIGQNVYLDVSYSFDFIDDERLIRMIRTHGHEKILFATDSPWRDPSRVCKKNGRT